MAPDASTNIPSSSSASSPRHMSENLGSPTGAQSRRPSRQVSSPWTQIVRGESEPIAAAPSSPQSRAAIEPIASVSAAPSSSLSTAAVEDEKSDNCGGAQGNAGKKPAWNRPSNGASEVGPVMGASSWPALSETTKAPSNKSSSDSLKSLSDGSSSSSSVPVSQGTGNPSVPAQKQAGSPNPNPTPNPSRQRSFKRTGASSSSNGSATHPSAQGSYAEVPLHSPSPRGHNQRNGFASQLHGGNDNQSPRSSYRNQNGGHHQGHGGRRNQEHGNHNWNPHRNFNGRDGHAQPQRGTPGFVRHAPAPVQPIPAPFMAAQPVQHFGSPVAFPELASPIYFPRVPYIQPPLSASFYYPVQDPPLYTRIQNQIHFYFSEENLIKDTYLRQFMDDQGFVQIQLIAGFKKVMELTNNVPHLLDALQGSSVVEVQGDRVRRRNNWQKFLLPANMRVPSTSSPQSGGQADTLAMHVRNLSLEQNTTDHAGSTSQGDFQAAVSTSRTLLDDPNAQQHFPSGYSADNYNGSSGSPPPSSSD